MLCSGWPRRLWSCKNYLRLKRKSMASYSSYKKVNGDQLASNSLSASSFSDSPNSSYGVKWFYGIICRCSAGCCCNWTVPTGVQNMWIQAWGSGGNGSGACSCNRCHHFLGAGGGYYNSKMIATTAGCQYTVCASGCLLYTSPSPRD